MDIDIVIKTMQASVAPCLLISGFGFLLLSMTNRLGRASDRIRALNAQLNQSGANEKSKLCKQINILFRRAQFLQSAIIFIVFSIFFVSINVLLLFTSQVFQLKLGWFIEICFATSLICLMISLSYFLLDIRITLKSLKIEIENETKGL